MLFFPTMHRSPIDWMVEGLTHKTPLPRPSQAPLDLDEEQASEQCKAC